LLGSMSAFRKRRNEVNTNADKRGGLGGGKIRLEEKAAWGPRRRGDRLKKVCYQPFSGDQLNGKYRKSKISEHD